MPTLYLNEDRMLVRRDTEDCLLIEVPAKQTDDGTITTALKKRIPLIKVSDVVVFGEVTLTASAVHLLMERRIAIHYLTRTGGFQGSLVPEMSKNSLLRLAQHQAHHTVPQRVVLARSFAVGKLTNQRTLLQRAQRRRPDAHLQAAIDQMDAMIQQLRTVDGEGDTGTRLGSGDTGIAGTMVEQILGLEGQSSSLYFDAFHHLMTDATVWTFPGRSRRPATDPVNALLNFGYALLQRQVRTMVQVVGFDPLIGYLHSSVYGRPALTLDLMEEFRPLMVDSLVVALLNNRIIRPDDFSVELGAYRLKDESRRTFLIKFEEKLNDTIRHPIFDYSASYRRCIELQARLLAKYLTKELTNYSPLIVR